MTKLKHVVPIVQDTLKAVLDKQPGPGKVHSLTVTVDAEVQVGWKVQLCSAEPQGFNPLIKLLEFDVDVPDGPHSDAIFRRTITYREEPAAADYTNVTLEDGRFSAEAKVSIIV